MQLAKCEFCQKEFDATPKSRNKKTPNRFCSRTCKNRAMGNIQAPDPATFIKPCEVCGEQFDSTPSRPRYEPAKRFCEKCFFVGRGMQARRSVQRVCEGCGKEFYVPECRVKEGKHRGKYCSRECAHKHWRNGGGLEDVRTARTLEGRRINSSGYVEVFVPDHPQAVRLREEGKGWQRARGWMLEHRLVMEQSLGRELLPTETPHHKFGDRTDNRIENLELWTTPQPTGVRVSDLIQYVVTYHRQAVLDLLSQPT